jgi:tetratricopeptide (TPR) repeat protein
VRAATATLLILALFATSAPVRAQEAARERERAALYQQGVDLAAAGNWAQAVERFKRVVELRASTKALYTLGEAQEHAGQLAAAKRSYRASLDSARAGAAKDIVDLAGQALGKLEGRVPQITVRLDQATAAHGGDTHASVDSHAAPIGAASDVDPGNHEVRVEATGAAPFVRTVHAVEGQQLDVVATLEWREVAAPPPPPPPPPP